MTLTHNISALTTGLAAQLRRRWQASARTRAQHVSFARVRARTASLTASKKSAAGAIDFAGRSFRQARTAGC